MASTELPDNLKPVLVNFYTDWCSSCQTMEGVLNTLKEQIGDRIDMIRIDVNKELATASAFRIRNVPTFILIKERKVIWQKSGLIKSSDLQRVIKSNL